MGGARRLRPLPVFRICGILCTKEGDSVEFHYEFTGPAGEELAGIFGALYAGMLLVFLLIGLALLVLRSFGLYVIAKRRGLRRPWLVWIPVAESWIIGSISDQYRYLVKGEYKSRRKILLGLAAANALLGISALIIVAATVGVVLPQATAESINAAIRSAIIMRFMVFSP